MYLNSMEDKLKQAIKTYLSGETLRRSSKSLHVDEERMKRVLIRIGKLRTRGEQISKGKGGYIIKQDALDVLTPEALYWIGFIASDGNIGKDRARIQIALQAGDIEHLRKMSKFFSEGDDIPVKESEKENLLDGYKCQKGVQLRFSSERIHKRLVDLGFTSTKTYNFEIHPSLKYSRDFWRGYVDGDGWIVNTEKNQIVGLCSYLESNLLAFLDFIRTNNIETEQIPRLKNNQVLYTLDFKHHKMHQILDLLYKDSEIYLDRKYESYKQIKNKTT